MRRNFSVSLLAVVLALFSFAQVGAGERNYSPDVTLAAAATPSMSVLSQIRKYTSPMVVQIGCRYDCEACRQSCYARMRVGCNTSQCRKAFSACMKGCWNHICRGC